MRTYAKAHIKFWLGDFATAIRGDNLLQTLSTYLIFSPHSTQLGIYRLPISYIIEDIGIPNDINGTHSERIAKAFERVSDALKRLIELDFCAYDWDQQVVFVVEAARHEHGENPIPLDEEDPPISNQLRGLANALPDLLREVRKSSVYNDFISRYGSDWAPLFRLAGIPAERVDNASGTRLERVEEESGPGNSEQGTVSREQGTGNRDNQGISDPSDPHPDLKIGGREDGKIRIEDIESVFDAHDFGLRTLRKIQGTTHRQHSRNGSTETAKKRRKLVTEAIRTYGVERSRLAARNLVLSDFHRGQHEKNTKEFLSIKYALGEQFEDNEARNNGPDKLFAEVLRRAVAKSGSARNGVGRMKDTRNINRDAEEFR